MFNINELDATALRGLNIPFPCVCALSKFEALPLKFKNIYQSNDSTRGIDFLSLEIKDLGEIKKVTNDSFSSAGVIYHRTYGHKTGRSTVTGKFEGKLVSVYIEDSTEAIHYGLNIYTGITTVTFYREVSDEPLYGVAYAPISKLRLKAMSIEPLLYKTASEIFDLAFNRNMIFSVIHDELENELYSNVPDEYTDLPDNSFATVMTYCNGLITSTAQRGVNVLYIARANEKTQRVSVTRSIVDY